MKTKKRKENEINKARKFKTIITIALSVMVVLVAVAWYYLEDKDLFVKVAFFNLWVGITTLFSIVYSRSNDYIEKRQDEIREIELEERAKIKRDFAEYIELVEEALKEALLETLDEEGWSFIRTRKWKNETKWLFYFSKKFDPNYTPIEVATLLVRSLRKHPPIAYKNQGGGDDVFTAKVSAIIVEKLLMHFKDYLEISYVDRDTLESLLIVVKKWGVYELIKINVF